MHHNGPQYFGYLGDNTIEQGNMHSLGQFYTDVASQALPAAGGVFYVRGGYYNNDGLLPIDPNPNVQGATPGNDDHPNYSDAQISETLIADSVNAIANSPYWTPERDHHHLRRDRRAVSTTSRKPSAATVRTGSRKPAVRGSRRS